MNPNTLFPLLFLVGLVLTEVLRTPHRWRNRQDRKQGRIVDARIDAVEVVLMIAAVVGMQLLPLWYVLSPATFAFAAYTPSLVVPLMGVVVMVGSLYLLWRAHHDLGQNWSPTLEISTGQHLVTGGVYAVVRHPIYTAVLLMLTAQALLLPNGFVGLAGLVLGLPILLVRIPREERLMRDHFGPAYAEYQRTTGGLLPRL